MSTTSSTDVNNFSNTEFPVFKPTERQTSAVLGYLNEKKVLKSTEQLKPLALDFLDSRKVSNQAEQNASGSLDFLDDRKVSVQSSQSNLWSTVAIVVAAAYCFFSLVNLMYALYTY